MSPSESPILISLKPRYADLIFKGMKKVELRRRDLTLMEGRDVFIYVTSPVMELQGGFRVGKVFTGTPQEIWDAVSEDGGVAKPDFDAYYADRELACALKIEEVWEYESPKGLYELRNQFAGFVVPQSWRYVKSGEHESFRRMDKRGERAGDTVAAPAPTPKVQQQPLLQLAPT